MIGSTIRVENEKFRSICFNQGEYFGTFLLAEWIKHGRNNILLCFSFYPTRNVLVLEKLKMFENVFGNKFETPGILLKHLFTMEPASFSKYTNNSRYFIQIRNDRDLKECSQFHYFFPRFCKIFRQKMHHFQKNQ